MISLTSLVGQIIIGEELYELNPSNGSDNKGFDVDDDDEDYDGNDGKKL